jgi:hypothetical protein
MSTRAVQEQRGGLCHFSLAKKLLILIRHQEVKSFAKTGLSFHVAEIVLFYCGLFNGAINSSGNMVSNNKTINE